jgi:hypothetical protein
VHRYALRRTDPSAAEEIASEAFLICWRRLEQVPDPPLPWLYATAGNVLANHRRAAARHVRRASAAAAEPAAPSPDPAERFAERDVVLAETALPVGDVHVLPNDGSNARAGETRITEVVERYERLSPTPENLKLLDAPAIDAAQR